MGGAWYRDRAFEKVSHLDRQSCHNYPPAIRLIPSPIHPAKALALPCRSVYYTYSIYTSILLYLFYLFYLSYYTYLFYLFYLHIYPTVVRNSS